MTNETYKIIIQSPLIRPGISIETEVSGKYLPVVLRSILEKVREFNTLVSENPRLQE